MDRFDNELKRIYSGWIYTNWLLVIIYPLALIHMIVFWCLNVTREHARARNLDILASHCLGFAVSFFLIWLADGETDSDTVTGFMILILGSLGLGAVFKACGNAARKSKVRLLYTYANLVMDDNGIQTVQDLASRVGRSTGKVTSALDFLIRIGLPAKWDYSGQITLLAKQWYLNDDGTNEYVTEVEYAATSEGPALVNVQCSGCGAKAQMYAGEKKACEYCGASL